MQFPSTRLRTPSALFSLAIVCAVAGALRPVTASAASSDSAADPHSTSLTSALSYAPGFGSLKTTWTDSGASRKSLFRNFEFSLSAEQVDAVGASRAGTLGIGTAGRLGPFDTRLGLLSGLRSRGEGAMGYAGSEQGIATELQLTDDSRLRLASRIDLREASFPDWFGFRWKWQNALHYRMGAHQLTLQNIRGPQPLPVEILPLSWDYEHKIRPWTRLAKLLGAGLAWEFPALSAARLSLMAGYYGGAPGAGLRLSDRKLGLTLGTWGIDPAEETSLRVWQGLLEYRY